MRPIPPPASVELDEIELFAAGVNRALQEIPDLQHAIIAGQEVELTDMDAAISSLVRTQHHDELQGVEPSVAHLLFLLLDGTRPMAGDLDMALNAINNVSALDMDGDIAMNEHVIDDIGTLNFDHAIGGFTYDLNITAATVLATLPGLQFQWARTGYTATGLIAPQYRSIDSVLQNLWVMADGLYVYDAGGGTGNIYLASGQFVSFIGTGTAPIKMLSTTMCANLNADLLDGYHGAEFAALAENELITGDWTFGGSAKAYFNDASALGGTEYITSLTDTFMDYVAFAAHRFQGLVIQHDGTIPAWGHAPTGLAVEGTSEFDGEAFFDGITRHYALVQFLGDARFNSAVDIRLNDAPRATLTFQGTGGANIGKMSFDDTINQAWMALRDTVGRQFIFTDWNNRTRDHGHAALGYPAVYVHGVADPAAAGATHWWRVAFDGTDGVYTVGSGVHKFTGGGMSFNSGMQVEQATISAAATLTSAHYIVLCDTDTAGAAFTVTLPAAASHAGRVYKIVNEGTGDYDVTVDGNGAEEINHETTQIVGDGQAMAIVCDGTAWWVI